MVFSPKALPLSALTLLLGFSPIWVNAQISGRVVDSSGTPLADVSIAAVRDGAQAVSLADGTFSLELLDEPVGTLAGSASALPAKPEVYLWRNPKTWQVEVHVQRGVYNLRGQYLRAANGAGVREGVASGEGVLRRALAQADTLEFRKAGYLKQSMQITDHVQNLGDVVLAGGYGSLMDSRDGRVYRTVKLGTQVWMVENLDFGTHLDGTVDQADASAASAQKYCYSNDEDNCTNYGGLYQWHTVMALPITCNSTNTGTVPCIVNTSHRGICPEDWHVPTREEWAILGAWVDNDNDGTVNKNEGTSLKSTNLWWFGGAGTDAFGWSGLPGGYSNSGNFDGVGSNGVWWSASQSNSDSAWMRDLFGGGMDLGEDSGSKSGYGLSLRCLQDSSIQVSSSSSFTYFSSSSSIGSSSSSSSAVSSSSLSAWCDTVANCGTFTDSRDGKIYRWTKIGDQVWMGENLDFGTRVAGTSNQNNATATSAQKYCFFNRDTYCTRWGALYQWHTVMALPLSCDTTDTGTVPCIVTTPHRGICPEEWHVPTREEWAILDAWVDTANGGRINDEGNSLKSTNWSNGTDAYGWTSHSTGYRSGSSFFESGNASWWSATQSSQSRGAWRRGLDYRSYLHENPNDKDTYGFSLRCLKDSP